MCLPIFIRYYISLHLHLLCISHYFSLNGPKNMLFSLLKTKFKTKENSQLEKFSEDPGEAKNQSGFYSSHFLEYGVFPINPSPPYF